MLRVLHCIYDDPQNPWVGGGGAVRVFELYRRLTRQVDVTVVTGSFPGARDEVIDGVRYRRLGARAPYAWSRLTYSAAATRLLARGGYDAAVFDFSTYTLLRVPRAQPVGITVHHLSEHTALDRWGTLAGRAVAALELARLRRARFYSATSAVMQQRLRQLVHPGARIHSVQAGVPDHLFRLPRHDDGGYLLFFGRMDWFHKGLDIVLATFAALARSHPALRLKIAGRGRDSARVHEAVRALGIEDRVDMLGAVSDEERDRLFSGAALMLMPSRMEGFGLAAAEAMAAGVPVVASGVGSLPEVVDPPRGGVIVTDDDPQSWAAAVDGLLRDSAARQRLGITARQSAARFDWARVAEAHLAFLTAIHEG